MRIFGKNKPILGMVHLIPLPESPRSKASLEEVARRALLDARTLVDSGFDGILMENFGDAPFFPDSVPASTVSSMTVIGAKLRAAFPGIPFGVNVLRNDSLSALSIAHAIGAEFIRVNIHTGAAVTDQGIIQAKAHLLLRLRKTLLSKVMIFADVFVKHARFLGVEDVGQVGRETVERGLADALIVTGPGTGEEPDLSDIKMLKTLLPSVPVLVGSGVTPQNARKAASLSDGAVVGTSVKKGGIAENPVDRERAGKVVKAWRSLR